MRVNFHNITRDHAEAAISAYNKGHYGQLSNRDVDRNAYKMFASGLALTKGDIQRQVNFIGRDYGGAAGFRAAYALAPDIANTIYENREQYDQIARSAPPILEKLPSREALVILYHPFVKLFHRKRNWHVWATKFWHFLNFNAFPMEDSRVDKFFLITQANSVDKYLTFLDRYRKFVLSHVDWLPPLRQIDGGLSWCDNKLWDKMCYGLLEPDCPHALGD